MSERLYIVSDDLLILAQFVHDCVKADRLLVVTTTANLFSLGNCCEPHKATTWYLFMYGSSHSHRSFSCGRFHAEFHAEFLTQSFPPDHILVQCLMEDLSMMSV